MTDKYFFFKGYSFAKKRVAGNLATVSHTHTLLDLDKCADLDVIANLAAVKVRECVDLYPLSQLYIRGDASVELLAHVLL
jgi:hypothetical protein